LLLHDASVWIDIEAAGDLSPKTPMAYKRSRNLFPALGYIGPPLVVGAKPWRASPRGNSSCHRKVCDDVLRKKE
jgi:hypothetical protein